MLYTPQKMKTTATVAADPPLLRPDPKTTRQYRDEGTDAW